jgi:hypothetical protein
MGFLGFSLKKTHCRLKIGNCLLAGMPYSDVELVCNVKSLNQNNCKKVKNWNKPKSVGKLQGNFKLLL